MADLLMKKTLNTFYILLILLIFSDSRNNWNVFPSTAPISVDKYTVVIIEETENRNSMPPSQLNAINSQVWKDYVVSQNGQWRVLDQDTDISRDRGWVTESMKLPRESLPWLIFASPTTGHSGPLPQNIEGLMEAIKK